MNKLFVESDGDRYPKDVYICETGNNDRLCTMDGTNETTMRHRAQEICDAVNALSELAECQRCLEIMTNLINHNSCTDGRTPNGFAVALDQARTALRKRGIKNP